MAPLFKAFHSLSAKSGCPDMDVHLCGPTVTPLPPQSDQVSPDRNRGSRYLHFQLGILRFPLHVSSIGSCNMFTDVQAPVVVLGESTSYCSMMEGSTIVQAVS